MQVKHAFTAAVFAYGGEGYAEIELIANSESPFSYDLHVQAQGVTWTFARSLLSDAFQSEGDPIGLGDVRTEVVDGYFNLTLESPEGLATLVIPSLDVLEFILESDTYIPTQRVDEIVTAEIDQFLSSLTEE